MDFERARDEAFRRLKTDRKKADIHLQWKIAEATRNTAGRIQVLRDMAIYPLWDAVAMWMDKKAGLAYYCPEDMERVGKVLRLTDGIYDPLTGPTTEHIR